MEWSSKQAEVIYNTPHWSEGYFGVNAKGHVVARPRPHQDAEIDLYEIAGQLEQHHLSLPVLVRFTNILHDRIDVLHRHFHHAMTTNSYQGGYTALYPIKVNQQHSVVQEILEYGGERVGLEVGSKPELLAALGTNHKGGVIVCNGYKDREYIRLALTGQLLGYRVFVVIEKLSELEMLLQEAAQLGVAPQLGIRVRLASIGAGKWQNTGGEKSKFGLSAMQVLAVIERLRQTGQQDALQFLHFHLGSQLVNIRDIQRGMHECARYYAELHRLGVKIAYVDVGGGLGVDYEGTRSRSACSMNYSIEGYANNIVRALADICNDAALPHPHIFTESGRAMTAHHAVLITDVIDSECVPEPVELVEPGKDAPRVLQDLWLEYQHVRTDVTAHMAVEVYHDTVHWLKEAHSLYSHGVLSLAQRAEAEAIYFAICRRVQSVIARQQRGHHQDVLAEINQKLADKYFCNFSLFQSIPDVWGIDQIFPIMPLHRLGEKPQRRVVLEDITCDSDGRIDNYVDSEGIEASLPLHSLREGERYLLGVFLVGAYQEILGDMHNLFGDTDSIHVALSEEGGYHFSKLLQGDSVEAVLRYVHFNPEELLERYRHLVTLSALDEDQRKSCLQRLEAGLHGYTYLERE